MFFAGLIPSYLALLAFLVAMVLTVLAIWRKQSELPKLVSLLAKFDFILQTLGVISLVVMLVLEDYTN